MLVPGNPNRWVHFWLTRLCLFYFNCFIDPKNSNFNHRKIRCRIIRFKSTFCGFSPKIKLFTGKRLEMIWNMYPFHMTSCPFRYSGEVKTNCIEWLIQGGPEPLILDDLCLGTVMWKYFSKLRFGTSKIQPELKCLENTLLSFYEPHLRARLWEHELFIVRSIAFISSVVK